MTDYAGIARLLSDTPTDAVSLDWLRKAHDAQLTLCATLEDIADSLPANVDRQECIHAAKSLLPLINGIHRYEEDALFPLLEDPEADDRQLAKAIARLKFEHVEDECFAEELADTLTRLGSGDGSVNAEAAGYMLRGFFESIRRHIAFEQQFVLRGPDAAP